MSKSKAEQPPAKAAILDYGLGNLFSVGNACEFVGMRPVVTSSAREILSADLVILPGVGAFADAMAALKKLDLVQPLLEVASLKKPLFGICLGMQLLMTESHEFGHHEGLGLIEGSVVSLDQPKSESDPDDRSEDELDKSRVKIPQVGWNRIFCFQNNDNDTKDSNTEYVPWAGTALKGLSDGEYMYFVHSFYAKPRNPDVVISTSKYGNVEFCSSLRHESIFACQFHPERSGPMGLNIYRNIAESLAGVR
tara:strand:- start:1844 stop:2596 length:753 start_codon:yes stop_codon:yes gene_type:complete